MAGASITVTLQDRAVRRFLDELVRRGTRLAPVMQSIAAELLSTAQDRFAAERAPDGTPWAALQPATVLARLGGADKVYTKKSSWAKGRMRKGAAEKMGALKILQDRRQLYSSLTTAADDSAAMVGTNKIYAALHQFGGADADTSNKGTLAVPARPYLGITPEDERAIGNLLSAYLAQAAA